MVPDLNQLQSLSRHNFLSGIQGGVMASSAIKKETWSYIDIRNSFTNTQRPMRSILQAIS
jgi:hypothetical protein